VEARLRHPGLATVLWLAAFASPALAQPFTVDSTADAVDAAPGDTHCATAGGACTLRAAVQEANALAGTDEIDIPVGTYRLTIAGAGEDAAATGDLDITSDVTIVGASGRDVKLTAKASDDQNANSVDRVLDVITGGSLTMSKATVEGGNGGSTGGSIRAAGALWLTDVRVAYADGVGVLSSAPVSLNRVTIDWNRGGGGLAVSDALTAVNVTITSNNGHGVHVLPGGSADLTNVTISRNFNGNQIRNDGSVQMRNSIVEHTVPASASCGGTPPVSGGHNVDDDGSCALGGAGDRSNVFAWTYWTLVTAGGETDVIPNFDLFVPAGAPPPPAVDIGAEGCPTTDQRGVSRPQGLSCDAGAFEATFADLTVTAVNVPAEFTGTGTFRYSLIIRNGGPTTSINPELSGVGTGTGVVPSMNGSACPYYSCKLGPLAPGQSVTVDMDQFIGPEDQPRDLITDWSVREHEGFDTWNIDPNADNSTVRVTVPLKPAVSSTPIPAQQPAAPLKPCSTRKTGTRRADVLRGTVGPDLIRGLGGNDRIKGLAGDDCIDGGPGNDVISGGSGKDKLLGGRGNDVIEAADRRKDTVDCGKGRRDRATVDRIDRVTGCEKVKRRR
jgi:CSLREA domain-containing protein